MMKPQLTMQYTECPCCVCGAPLEKGKATFQQRLPNNEVRSWHQGACNDHMRGTTYHELRAEEDAELNAEEAADLAEDRHLRNLGE